jgi:tetratricopeptide (TPR) repeat protein
VFRCVHPRTGRDVAIKVLTPGPARDRPHRRFAREVKALSALDHPHVVRVLDTGQDRGRPYLVMELIEGQTLEERLVRDGPLPIDIALDMARKLARAVTHAHARGMLHRDLKPDNVLLDARGQPYLADFGLTRALSGDETRLTETGALMGTPGYWAPEQVAPRLGSPGPGTDIYGLGAILYASLTGQPPIPLTTISQMVVATAETPPAPPSQLRPDVPRWLEEVCLRCLEKSPSRRYPTAGALQAALESADSPRPAPPARVPAALLVLVPVGLMLGLALGWVLRSDAGHAPLAADTPTREPAADDQPAAGMNPGDSPPTDAVATVAELIESARAKSRSKDYPGALADLDQAIALDPTAARAWADRGSIKTMQGDAEAGLADCDQAVRLDPTLARAWSARGWTHLRREDHQAALADCDEALRLDPHEFKAWGNRGMARQALGDLEGAIADYGEAIRLDDAVAGAWASRGLARLKLGDLDEALLDLNQALLLDPNNVTALGNRGLVRARQADFAGARADLERAIELDPSSEPKLRPALEWLDNPGGRSP